MSTENVDESAMIYAMIREEVTCDYGNSLWNLTLYIECSSNLAREIEHWWGEYVWNRISPAVVRADDMILLIDWHGLNAPANFAVTKILDL